MHNKKEWSVFIKIDHKTACIQNLVHLGIHIFHKIQFQQFCLLRRIVCECFCAVLYIKKELICKKLIARRFLKRTLQHLLRIVSTVTNCFVCPSKLSKNVTNALFNMIIEYFRDFYQFQTIGCSIILLKFYPNYFPYIP